MAQSQTAECEENTNGITVTEEYNDTYIHYHNPDYIHQTLVRPQWVANVPVAPGVLSPLTVRTSVEKQSLLNAVIGVYGRLGNHSQSPQFQP